MTLRVIFVGWMETVLECVDSIKINSIPYGRTQSRRPIDGRNSKWHRMISILIVRERQPGPPELVTFLRFLKLAVRWR